MAYATQHALPTGMQPVPQAISPAVQVARRANWEAGFGVISGILSRGSMATSPGTTRRTSMEAGLGEISAILSKGSKASPPRRARMLSSARRILMSLCRGSATAVLGLAWHVVYRET